MAFCYTPKTRDMNNYNHKDIENKWPSFAKASDGRTEIWGICSNGVSI